MLKSRVLYSILFISFASFSAEINDKPISNTSLNEGTTSIDYVESVMIDTLQLFYVDNKQLYAEGWDKLAHPHFWRTIMRLSPDSCVINIAATRQIVTKMSLKEWDARSDKAKDAYRDSIRQVYNLDKNASVYMTTGKSDFYLFDNILPSISRGVQLFESQGVDPWYAQAILMIESPGKLAKSNAGAYGSFQLMPEVARKFGLTVNKHVDERKDFDKSAIAASQLIQTVCIPEAKRMLTAKRITVVETDLWFRLFVMHIYHAGAGNVSAVVNKINPVGMSGSELIQTMWVTKEANFGNASQNYSQLALATMMVLDDMIWNCY